MMMRHGFRRVQPKRDTIVLEVEYEWEGKNGDHATVDQAIAMTGRCNLP